MRLLDMTSAQEGIIVKVLGHGAFRKRVIEMGFVRGKRVKMEHNAPFDDPIKYSILGYEVTLRRAEAELIEVIPVEEWEAHAHTTHTNVICDSDRDSLATNNTDTAINIAFIGNPNCGKTSLFNCVSGSKERVGNYSGVTVDAKECFFEYKGYKFKAVDLPGSYSLSACTSEELYVRRFLKDSAPDVIVNVVVASNLERNLYLTTELIDMDQRMVIALNMYDEMRSSGAKLNHKELGKMIGVPMVPTVSKTGEGVDELLENIISVYENRNESVRHVHVNLGSEMESAIKEIKDSIKACRTRPMYFSPRYLAIKLLENDSEVKDLLRDQSDFEHWMRIRDRWVRHIESVTNDDIPAIIASEKYGFISGAMREMYEPGTAPKNVRQTDIIDSIITHKYLGFPVFLLLMWLMFWATFTLGEYPMVGIDWIVDLIGNLISDYMAEGALKDMITDGVIGGVGGVIVFLTNLLFLFLFISFMEDSGYMSRAAFIMDRIMHGLGLHGKSFIPLVMGFGCNVPAIMSTRIIESRSSRLITILIVPFMSCSARLPIFILMVGAFFQENAALMLVAIYLVGLLFAVITAKILRRFYFKWDETPFVMELPPYRIPTLKATLHHMWEKGEQYLRKMGGVILFASILVWALNYFPRDLSMSNGVMTSAEIKQQKENSFLGLAGKAMEPVMEPIGLNWKATVAVLSGIPAKEIVVSTLGVLYADENDASADLYDNLKQINPKTGKPDFNQLTALSFMVFVLLFMPCVATITAISKEAGSWKYGAFSIAYNTIVSWLAAFLVYQGGLLLM